MSKPFSPPTTNSSRNRAVYLNLYLGESLAKRFKIAAKKAGISQSALARAMLVHCLEDMERENDNDETLED